MFLAVPAPTLIISTFLFLVPNIGITSIESLLIEKFIFLLSIYKSGLYASSRSFCISSIVLLNCS